jgi:hypothetical protein
MRTSAVRPEPRAVDVACDAHSIRVRLVDGREITVPLEWFPRLRSASADALKHWRIIGGGVGLHWPDLDEDISVEALLATR